MRVCVPSLLDGWNVTLEKGMYRIPLEMKKSLSSAITANTRWSFRASAYKSKSASPRHLLM